MNLKHLNAILQKDAAELGITDAIPPTTLRPRFQIHCFETLPSTNSKLWDLFDQGAPAGTVVIARQQQAGRGQWGRQWQSSPGGVYLSLLLAPDLPTQHSAQLTQCTAWGIAQTLQNLSIPVQLKWPNDLVLQRRKLGGILTETRVQAQCIKTAVVGVGLNWNNPVPDSGIQLKAALPSHPLLNCLEALAAVTLRGMMQGYQVLQTAGPQPILQAYQRLLLHLGQSCQVQGRSGKIIGVTAAGDLRVELASSSELQKTEIQLQPGSIHLGYGSHCT